MNRGLFLRRAAAGLLALAVPGLARAKPWTHLAVTHDALGEEKIYVNGVIYGGDRADILLARCVCELDRRTRIVWMNDPAFARTISSPGFGCAKVCP